MRILFTGGGTGGHLFPLVAVVRELKKIAEEKQILGLDLYYMGPENFVEFLKEEGVAIIPIVSGKWRHYDTRANILDIFKICKALIQGLWNMFLLVPDVVFSKGGYGALPAVVAAALLRIPLIIHESDSVPGRVNNFSARFARRIGVAFSGADGTFPKEKTALVGVPIRKRLLGASRAEAKERFSIFSNLPTIGIIGASQGSKKINDTVLGILKELTDEFEIVHQTGRDNYTDVAGEGSVILEFSHKERYHPIGFLTEQQLRDFYATSDLIISRASATVMYEIAAWGKPAILIPLESASQEHQKRNAYEYAAGGAAVVIEEANLSPHILRAEIKKILGNPTLMRSMSEAAQKFSRIDAAELVAEEILKMGIH